MGAPAPRPALLKAPAASLAQTLREVYRLLYSHYGPQHWWPGDGPFEIMVGAVLTQSVNWGNVERAIANLKQAQALSPSALRTLPLSELSLLIRPVGFHRVKALKLRALGEFLKEFDDDTAQLFALDTMELRARLLAVYGIGEETADSIALYAAGKPLFVIDAYTRRILERLADLSALSYHSLQRLFMEHLPPEPALFNEYHALLVRHGKETCRQKPRCPLCPLNQVCPSPQHHPTE